MQRKQYGFFILATIFFLHGCAVSGNAPFDVRTTANRAYLATPAPIVEKAVETPPFSASIPLDKVFAPVTPAVEFENSENLITFAEPAPNTVLATFSTEYKGAVKSRAHNIELAAQKINGILVQPGEVFSFNEAVGPTTKKNGFMLGRIFVKGQESKGYGGGVCQVSSTVFNAADAAGMVVTERHHHSRKVEYVEEGKDAATSYGKADLKFMNNQNSPIRIKSFTSNQTVTVTIETA